eukprot:3566307-Pyramimonas_sp.AAC.1
MMCAHLEGGGPSAPPARITCGWSSARFIREISVASAICCQAVSRNRCKLRPAAAASSGSAGMSGDVR